MGQLRFWGGPGTAILYYKLVTPPVELVTNTHNNNKLYTTEETPLIEIENFTPHPNYA